MEEKRRWQCQTVNLWIQVEPDALFEILKSLVIGVEVINIFLEERKRRCFGREELDNFKWDCSRKEYKEEEKEKENERTECSGGKERRKEGLGGRV